MATRRAQGRTARWLEDRSRQCWGAVAGFLLVGTAAGCLAPGDGAVAGGAVLVGLGWGWLVGDSLPGPVAPVAARPDEYEPPATAPA